MSASLHHPPGGGHPWLAAFARRLLGLVGWRVRFEGLPGPKGVAIVYPHTSNWDFIIGLLAKWTINLPIRWIGKESLFHGVTGATLGRLMRMWGGRPVDRQNPSGAVEQLAQLMNSEPWFWLGLSPEGTRRHTDYIRSGFYHLALKLDLPVALGILASIRGDYDTMIRLGEEAVQLSEQYDQRWNRPYAYYLLTRAALAQGDYEQAQHHAQEASLAAQESKDRWFLAYCLVELGNVALAQDQFALAKEHYQASYAIRQEFADREGMALALNRLGTVTFRQQAYAEARSLYLQSLDLYRELNDKGGLASTLNGLGFVASEQADYATAAQHFQQALRIVQDLHFTPLALWVLLGIGEMLLKTRQIERGVELLGLVEHHPAAEREARLRGRVKKCSPGTRRRLPRTHSAREHVYGH